MRLLVTGASGFVGSHLCRHLAGAGHHVATLGSDAGCDYRVDVCDAGDVSAAVRQAAPDAIAHLAAVAFVPHANADPDLADRVNRGGTANVLDAAAAIGARTLAVSSGAVYGKVAADRMPIDEDFQLNPADAYARSKAAAERECLDRAATQEVVRVRPFNITGPGQARDYVCSDFAGQIAEAEAGLRERRIRVGDLRAERDFTDVRDAVGAYALALERGDPGQVYNICTGVPVSISSVLDRLLAVSTVDVEVDVERSRLRPGEVNRYYGSAARLEAATGWGRTIGLDQTLADLLDDWRARVGRKDNGS